ncbi:hypothetical protein AHAS_Ahas19G0297400 [Arachis hypogaea]
MEISNYSIGPTLVRARAHTVVDEYNPGAYAPAEEGGSAAPGVDNSVRGHLYDLRIERNPLDRYTPSRFGQGMMGKGLNWLVRKK